MKRRTMLYMIAALLVVVVVGTLFLRSTREQPAPRGQARPAGATGMEDMEMDGGIAQLTTEQIRAFGIQFATVEMRTMSTDVRAAGVVRVAETRITQVAPRFAGFAERLYADFTGQFVRRGQPLLEVYSPELISAQEELLIATRLAGANTGVPGAQNGGDLVAAARARLQLWGITTTQIDQVVRSGASRRTLVLYAPSSGVITDKQIVRGQAFMAGQPLYTITDLSVVWVEAELREMDAASIGVGAHATVEFTALGGLSRSGRVQFVAPMVREETRTLRARIEVPNPDGRVRPGMYATVGLSAPQRSALTVPTSAIVNTGERRIVFVDMGNGRFVPRDVEIGRVAGDLTEILAGLEPGQRVVTSAQFILDSESNLGEVMRSMIGQTGTADMPGTDR